MQINETLSTSSQSSDEFTISNAILLINTLFTLATPIIYMILKMIKKCQLGRNTFIETRSDNSGTSTPVNNQNLPTASQLFGRFALNRVVRNIETNNTPTIDQTTIISEDNK